MYSNQISTFTEDLFVRGFYSHNYDKPDEFIRKVFQFAQCMKAHVVFGLQMM